MNDIEKFQDSLKEFSKYLKDTKHRNDEEENKFNQLVQKRDSVLKEIKGLEDKRSNLEIVVKNESKSILSEIEDLKKQTEVLKNQTESERNQYKQSNARATQQELEYKKKSEACEIEKAEYLALKAQVIAKLKASEDLQAALR